MLQYYLELTAVLPDWTCRSNNFRGGNSHFLILKSSRRGSVKFQDKRDKIITGKRSCFSIRELLSKERLFFSYFTSLFPLVFVFIIFLIILFPGFLQGTFCHNWVNRTFKVSTLPNSFWQYVILQCLSDHRTTYILSFACKFVVLLNLIKNFR